eukprot:5926022-Pyramimonas_sp.AAC.1
MGQPSPESGEQPLPSPALARNLLRKALAEAGACRALGAVPPGAVGEITHENAADGEAEG